MLLSILLVLARLAASFFLFTSGALLLFENDNKKSIRLWGFGQVLWSSSIFIGIFSFADGDVSLALYLLMRTISLISFVLFLFRGTLSLLVPARETKIFSAVYLILTLILDFTINSLDSTQYDNLAIHSVYILLPMSIVFFSYFYTYYIQLKDKNILYLSASWGSFFIFTLLFMMSNSIQIDWMQRLFLLFSYMSCISIAFSFDNMRKVKENWHKVTAPKNYVIDSDLLNFMNEEFHMDTKPMIEGELEKHGSNSVNALSESQKRIFIDNLLNVNFPEMSKQRKNVVKTKLNHLLGLSMDSASLGRASTEMNGG